jgi:hypothetical protein
MMVMMLILETPEDFANRGGGPAAQEYWNAWQSYSQSVGDKIVGGNVLDSADKAATIRVKNGERQIQDGPFAESKENLGGYMIFEVDAFDDAVELASTCPAATRGGAVELRPIREMPAE